MCCQGLSAAAQDAQVLRWAAVEDGARLDKALAGHNTEVKKRVQDVQTTRQVLSIQNASPHASVSESLQQSKPFWQSVVARTPGAALFWLQGSSLAAPCRLTSLGTEPCRQENSSASYDDRHHT